MNQSSTIKKIINFDEQMKNFILLIRNFKTMSIIQKIKNFFQKIVAPSKKNERTDVRNIQQLKRLTIEEQAKIERQREINEISILERKRLEQERLQQIHSLYESQFHDYLQEAQKFRHEFGKNIQCDVCGRWDRNLIFYNNQTYCENCIPPSYDRTNERKIIAGRHGAATDFIKK
jgi:hypothetical protein